MASKDVKFRVDLEQPLPHPEEVCVVTFIGRATVKAVGSYRTCEVTHLWMGVNIPTKEAFSWHVRKVSLPNPKQGGWKRLAVEIEQAALDAYDSPVAITLPDEVRTSLAPFVWGLQPSGIFK